MDLWSWFYRLRLDDLHRTTGPMNLRSWFDRLWFDDQRFGSDWLMNLNGASRFVDRWPRVDGLDFRSDRFVSRWQWLDWLQFGADRFVYGVQWHRYECRTNRHVGGTDREMPRRAQWQVN